MREEKYVGAEKAGEVCSLWPSQAASEMGKMVDQIKMSNAAIERIAGTKQHIAVKAGFAAEAVHAETFNLDAILKDRDVRAFTDGCKNTPLARNDTRHDIVIMKGDQKVLGAQSKYFQNGEETQKAFRDLRDGVPHYKECDVLLGPADQLEDIKSSARRVELRNQETRPQVSEAARDIQQKATDRLEVDGVESRPVTNREAKDLVRGDENGKDGHGQIQEQYQDASSLKHGLRAAQSAALVTAIIAGSVNVVHCLGRVQAGKMSAEDAFRYVLQNTAIAAMDSAAKAGASTMAVSLAVRSMPDLFNGTVLQSGLIGGGIAGVTICAVDLVECLVLVAAGKMTMDELQTRTGKNLFQTGAGVVGASIGAALGAPAGPIGALVGSLIGGLIMSVATTLVIDNHFEKPFRVAVDQARALVGTGHIMQHALHQLEYAQAEFVEFRVGCYVAERSFDRELKQLERSGVAIRRRLQQL